MRFKFIAKGFADTGKEYTVNIDRKYINGFRTEDGTIVMYDDITIIEMSDAEKAMEISL